VAEEQQRNSRTTPAGILHKARLKRDHTAILKATHHLLIIHQQNKKDQTATASLSTKSIMQKPSLEEDVPQSSREASASSSKSNPRGGDETILQEKERIAGRSKTIKSKEAVSTDDRKLKGWDETILQEKQRIAGRSNAIKSKGVASIDDIANVKSDVRSETILEEKQRIAGRSNAIKSKKAAPTDGRKLKGRDETILEEKQRIAGRSNAIKSKGAAPNDDRKLKGRDETILEEKQRIAGRSKTIKSKEFASIDDIANERSDVRGETIMEEKNRMIGRSNAINSKEVSIASRTANGFPGAVRMEGTRSESSELDRQDTRTNGPDRSDREGSNEVTYPGAVRIAGPGTDSSDLERQGTIMIGSDRNIVANTPEESNENNEEGLIHAQVVDDVALVTAQPDPWWRRNQWWLAGSAAVVLVGIILAVVLTTVELSPSQEAPPTMAPTTVIQGIEANTKQLILSNFNGTTEAALSDQSTPQFRALQWVTNRINNNGADYSMDARVLQQYSLATLYYSTNGESAWNQSDGWLNTTNECEWYGVECSEEEGESEDSDPVVGLNLTDNGLDGTLPSDLALLSASLTVVDLSNNDLSGPIPSEIGKLTLLEDLFLSENHLADSIPTTISGMTKLVRMDLSMFEKIPREIGSLRNLESLDLSRNLLTGWLPSSLQLLTQLSSFRLSDNFVKGNVLAFDYGVFSLLSDSLLEFDLSSNFLTGTLPYDIWILSNLESLNQLGRSESIPEQDHWFHPPRTRSTGEFKEA
jgi:hypothetical protein